MMMRLLIVAFMLGICSAVYTPPKTPSPGEDAQPPVPAPCCVPKQWEGYVGMVQGYVRSGEPGLQNVTIRESYDFMRKMIAIHVVGLTPKVKVIMDYNKMEQYTITGTTCTTARIMSPGMVNCLPMNSTYMGSFHYGGMEGLLVDSWSIVDPFLGTKGVATMTRQDCVMVTETLINPPGSQEPSLSFLGVVDVTMGIKDPTVFDAPSSCHHSSENDVVKTVPGIFLFTGQ